MLKLYYTPKTRALRPRWVLEELGVPHELVRVDLGARENRKPSYLAVHPLGSVPALDDEGTIVIESSAICAYLAEKFPEGGLTPAYGSKERGLLLQWIVYGTTTLEPALVALGREDADELARDRWRACCGVVERALEGRPFLLGEQFTVADVVIGSVIWWARSAGRLERDSKLAAYGARLRQRPAATRALAD
jgi:glutathione S-transferase